LHNSTDPDAPPHFNAIARWSLQRAVERHLGSGIERQQAAAPDGVTVTASTIPFESSPCAHVTVCVVCS
jgi:hypothetical protein